MKTQLTQGKTAGVLEILQKQHRPPTEKVFFIQETSIQWHLLLTPHINREGRAKHLAINLSSSSAQHQHILLLIH